MLLLQLLLIQLLLLLLLLPLLLLILLILLLTDTANTAADTTAAVAAPVAACVAIDTAAAATFSVWLTNPNSNPHPGSSARTFTSCGVPTPAFPSASRVASRQVPSANNQATKP